MSESNIDFQEFISELSKDSWCAVHVERVLYKLTNKALSQENQQLKERIEELSGTTGLQSEAPKT